MALHPARPLAPAPVAGDRYRSITEIAAADWPAEHTFLQRGYLQALEEQCAGQLRFDYALLRAPGGVVAGAVFQTVDIDPDAGLPVLRGDFVRPAARSAWRPWVRGFLRSLRLRVVICGNVFATGPHGTWRDHRLDVDRHRTWLLDAAAQVTERARAPGVRVLTAFKDVDDPAGLVAQAPDYHPLVEDPAMALTLDPAWRTLDDYVGALRSSYRREYRRAREQGARLARRRLSSAGILRHAGRIDELHDQVLSRARLVPVRKDARVFARLDQLLGSRFSLIGYFDGARMVGFNTRFVCGADLDSHFFGMDYAVSEDLSLYRNMLYDDIGDAIGMRRQRVLFGRASQEIKSAMGAEPMPLHNFIRHDSRLLTSLLAASARWLAPAPWSPRRPFRRR